MTEVIDRTPVDKSTWGEGPWQSEPDRVEFEHAGLPCLALRNILFGFWCGYVAVPPTHAYHGKGYSELPDYGPEVHGGLTYASSCDGSRICHTPKPGESGDVWWFGFDCGHCWDFSPAQFARYRHDPRFSQRSDDEVYRELRYTEAQIRSLAEQLAAVSKGEA